MPTHTQHNWLVRRLLNTLVGPSPHRRARKHLCDFDRICHEIIPGDVLLMEGTSPVSDLIKKVIHSPWTHASLYIGRLHSIEDPEIRQQVQAYCQCEPSDQLLLETWPLQGTIITPVKHYAEEHIRICRPDGISHQDTQQVINYAVSHLGGSYDWRHFFDLGRFTLASKWLPKRWRSSLFQRHKPTRISKDICSALIAEAFTSINFPILPFIEEKRNGKISMMHRNPKLFVPSDFDYSPYFKIIKYPIIPGHNSGHYHGFPWDLTQVDNEDSDAD